MHFSALRTTLLAGVCALAATAAAAQTADFISCLDGIKAEAVRQGVPAAVADRALANLTPDQKVLDLDSRQPEFSLTYGKYIGSADSPHPLAPGQPQHAHPQPPLPTSHHG